MKESGIVRRIDELGRIVIPKELRRTMRLRVGDELEITASGDTLTLKKYSVAQTAEQAIKAAAEYLSRAMGADVLFIDSSIRVAEGKNRSKYMRAALGDALSDAARERKECVLNGKELDNVFENSDFDFDYVVTAPVMSGGDVYGAFALVLQTMPGDLARAYLNFTAGMISAIIDDER